MDPQWYDIQTPEQVPVRFQLAGIGTRGIAQLIDALLLAVAYAAVAAAVAVLQWQRALGAASSYVTGFLIVAGFLSFWGYFVLCEYLWSGRTVGKRLLCIRAISGDGRPLSFWAAVVRNVLRIVDFLPSGCLVGVAAMLLDRASRRVGDIAAGSVVVRDRPAELPPLPALAAAGADAVGEDEPRGIQVTLPDRTVSLLVRNGLPPEWGWFLAAFERRRKGLANPARRELVEQVWQLFTQLPWVEVRGADEERWPLRDKERLLAAAARALDQRARRGGVPGARPPGPPGDGGQGADR
ncbi:MAG: RDD family protein [Alicyclobacillaceae bacterium]|nr:RDD family protein [Alicyclobacillaceae bacterium]